MAPLSIRQAERKVKGSCNRRHDQQLLPGIPDEITLHEISPKLPWKVFYILSAVSRAWGHAIRSRDVYDARALSHLTETCVIVDVKCSQGIGIGLWSMRENYLIPLPRITHRSHLVVPLDGRIYILGRQEFKCEMFEHDSIISDEVFVLDVAAGEKLWRKCASMGEERRDFSGAVSGGKIYVCGGEKFERRRGQKVNRGRVEFCGSEVYDPKKDLWSPIKPMAERYEHRIEAVGEELFVLDGQSKSGKGSSFLNIYHPWKDEWRVMNPFESCREVYHRHHLLFVAKGKLHSIDDWGIHVYDAEENSWTELHSYPFIEPRTGYMITGNFRTAVVHVDGELLIKYWLPSRREICNFGHGEVSHDEELCFAKSNGFGGMNKEMVWQEVPLTNSLLIVNRRKLTSILL